MFNITVNSLGDGTKLTLCELAGDSNLGEVLSTWEGSAATLRNLSDLEKWTDRNIIKFNKSKLRPVHPAWHDPVHPSRSGAPSLESSFAETEPVERKPEVCTCGRGILPSTGPGVARV